MGEQAADFESLLYAAAELQPHQRPSFLASQCDDTKVIAKVQSLLRHMEQTQRESLLPELPWDIAPQDLEPGETPDFQIRQLLGRGAFGAVYLARQISLPRDVALKITSQCDGEAQNMAPLQHEHIVQVYSEHREPGRQVRQICMQYVPGVTFKELISKLATYPRSELSGARIIEAIDILAADIPATAATDPAGLKNRDRLVQCDYFEAVCILGAQLCAALEYAHSRNVLHRDIKAANVLIDRNGRPYLADFGMSTNLESGDVRENFGGTLAYMAPEHLDAIHPDRPVAPSDVDARSDLYSLGVVIRELLTLQSQTLTDSTESLDRGFAAQAARLSAVRRQPVESLRKTVGDIPGILDRAVQRFLQPDPQQRYATAAEAASVLEACRENMRIEKQLPRQGFMGKLAAQQSFAVSVLTSHLPHLAGCLFCPTYNAVILFANYSAVDRLVFIPLSIVYALMMFPAQAMISYIWFRPATHTLNRLRNHEPVSHEEVNAARRRILHEPLVAFVQSILAWVPLLAYAPAYVYLFIAPMTLREFAHLTVSVGLSLLLTGTYSFLIIQYYVVRVWYPLLLIDPLHRRRNAAKELQHIPGRARLFYFLALFAPFSAAVLLMLIGPSEFGEGSYYATFRVVVVFTMLLGLAGTQFSQQLSTRIIESVNVLMHRTPPGDL